MLLASLCVHFSFSPKARGKQATIEAQESEIKTKNRNRIDEIFSAPNLFLIFCVIKHNDKAVMAKSKSYFIDVNIGISGIIYK